MNYAVLPCHNTGAFSQYIKSIYLLSSEGKEEAYGCVPNGQVGISIVLRGSGYLKVGTEWLLQPEATVYGLVRRAQFHKMSADFCELNINFAPHFLQMFIKGRLSGLDNNGIDLAELFPKENVTQLKEQLNSLSSLLQIPEIIQSFLMALLKSEKADPRIAFAHDLIASNKIARVNELSSMLNLSSTSLRNLFREKVGISPKELIQIHRIRKSLEAKNVNEQSMTKLAYCLDYFDQAHFIHDFKEAVGLTPKQYFQNEKLTFDFYNFGRWRSDSFAPDFIP